MRTSSWSLFNLLPVKFLANVFLSNVDKIVDKNEIPVSLCNYLDVYNNERISSGINFSKGTANAREIEKFTLQPGDVIITKDSETPNDIAVPAIVNKCVRGLVCGYHLAIIRPIPTLILGDYLFWCLKAKPVQEEFGNRAQGITRFGLTLGGIKSVLIPNPSIETQHRIAEFLDRETARIDELIEKREAFLELIAEKSKALLAEMIYGENIDENVDEKEWFGCLPKGWKTRRAKFLFRERKERSSTGQEELLTVSHITGITPRSSKEVNMFLADSMEGYKLVLKNDVVINTMWAWMGAMGVSPIDGIISPSYGVYVPLNNVYEPEYMDLLLRSRPFVAEVKKRSKGVWSSRLRLYPDAFLDISLPVPPRGEQLKIINNFHKAMEREDFIASVSRKSLERLREFRAALITAAITGQIDIDEWTRRGSTDRRLDA